MATAADVRSSTLVIEELPMRRYEDVGGPTQARRISWGAVFGGTAVGLVLQVWLAMLGVAIGVSAIDPMRTVDSWQNISTGSAVWLAVSVIISSFIGGWIAVKLAGAPRRLESALHGAVSWATANIITFLLIGTVAGAVFSGASSLAGGSLWNAVQAQAGDATAANTAAKAATGTSWGLVILMFLGLCSGIGGALLATPSYSSTSTPAKRR